MKKKLLLFSIATVFTLGTTFANTNFQNISPINDTVPKAKVKTENQAISDTAFADLENELNELKKTRGGANADTTKVRVGKLKISVIDDGQNVIIEKDKSDYDDWGNWDKWDEFDKEFRTDVNKNFHPHWASFYIGMNNYMTADQSLTLPDTAGFLDLNTNKSIELGLNIAELGIPIVKHRIGLVTGFGLKWNQYNFRNSAVVLQNDSSFVYHTINDTSDFSKSKLSAFYVTVPLMLEFQVPIQDKPLYLSGGVEAGLKIGSRAKNKTSNGVKNRTKGDFHLMPYTLAATARLGYDSFGVYASYNLTTLFKENEGPELYPFSVGISINF